MTEWNYFVMFEPPESSSESPFNVLRQADGASRQDAELLTTAGQWGPTDVLARIFIGRNETDVEAVSRERAAELAHGWLAAGRFPHLPPDLA